MHVLFGVTCMYGSAKASEQDASFLWGLPSPCAPRSGCQTFRTLTFS